MSLILNFSSSLMVLALVLALVVSYISPTISTSRHTFDSHDVRTGFKVTLKHVDSNGNFTKFELLQRAMKRGRKRMQRLRAMTLAESSPSIVALVHAGEGDYRMDLSIGTPPLRYSAILDTGSDLIWAQCKPCEHCYEQPTPIFDPKMSSSYTKIPCSSDLCAELPGSNCSDGNCKYRIEYDDHSMSEGVMAFETFMFDNVSVPKLGFGCGFDNEGGFGEAAGLVGMGRGALSLMSQLKEPKFSYCLTSIGSNKTSTLLVGSKANTSITYGETIKTTLLIRSTSSSALTAYYLSLKGITVGDTALAIDNSTFALKGDGSGGMIIDSGTMMTYLVDNVFDLLKKEFIHQIKAPMTTSSNKELEICFILPSDTQVSQIPKIVFHFEGADLDLPPENCLIGDPSGATCLAIGRSSDDVSVFGNIQQQNMLVVYDLVGETISFMPTQCDQL